MKAAKEVRHRRQPVRWRRSCCAGERRMGRGGPATLPPHGRRASDRQRPVVIPAPTHRHSRERRPLHNHVISAPTPAVIPPKAGIHGGAGGGATQQQSKRHSPPKLPAGPPKQSIILFALSSFSIRKKRLDHHTKLNIQTRSGRPSRGLTRWPGGAYRASGGGATQQQSKRHSPPKLPAGPPKQSIILFALSSFSIRKKRLNHHTKLNIQTRSGRPSRGLTRWPGGAYRASWPGGRPTHRPGGD